MQFLRNLTALQHYLYLARGTRRLCVGPQRVQGTLIRVFDTATGRRIHEVRRGSDRAAINWCGLAFLFSCRLLSSLACSNTSLLLASVIISLGWVGLPVSLLL